MGVPPIVVANKLTLLELVGQAAQEIGIKAPTSLFNNPDPQAVQLLALAQREGKDFYQIGHRRGGWQVLRGENVYTTVSYTYTGTTVTDSAVITSMSSTVGLGDDIAVSSGTGIDRNARIVTRDSSSQITLDLPCTASGAGVSIIFGEDRYPLPDDFQYFQQMTWWDRTYRWQMEGPLTAQQWQTLKSGLSPVGPKRFFRVIGNWLQVHPVPSVTGNQLVFEYQSNGWCLNPGRDTQQSLWVTDEDYYLLDDDAFILGIKWRFKAAKGFDYTQEKIDYDIHTERLIARDGGNKDLLMNTRPRDINLINTNQVPDTGFGS